MAKEWILNQANMRWGLTRKTKVGAVADLIRKCAPKELAEWEGYYYKNGCTKAHLEELGRKLFVPQIIAEAGFQKKTHEKFTAKYGGKVFYIISIAEVMPDFRLGR